MKTLHSLCLSLLLVATATAGHSEGRTDINPALIYYRSFLLVPDLPQADRDYLFNTEWRGQKLPEKLGTLISKYDNQFSLLRQAAQQTVACDWGIDLTPGPATLLPQLARNKNALQTTRLRVMWQLQHGHQAEAREDLLAGFTLARSSSQDGTLIAALVQIAAENICYSIIAENFYQFSPETLEQLLKGFDAAPARSTIADCIESERAFFRDWLVNKIRGWQQAYPGNDAKVMAEIHDIVASTEGEEEGKANQVSLADRVSKAAGGTSEGVLKLLEQEEPFYQRITAILALPPAEYESQIKAFMADVQASPNPFIQPFFNSWEKCRAREYVLMIRQAQVRAAIELKLRGQEAFRSVSDPLGNGPFALSRFNFEGVDRGFELKSAYEGKYPNTLIFVEKDGPPFRLEGPNAGKPVTTP